MATKFGSRSRSGIAELEQHKSAPLCGLDKNVRAPLVPPAMPGRLLAALLFCCLATCASAADEPGKKMSLHQLPPAVQKTIQAHSAGAKLGEIEREEDNGKISYTVTVAKEGHERDFTVGDDGVLKSEEVTLEETPQAVQRTIKAQVGEGTLDNVEKTFEDSQIGYEADMTRKDGAERSFTVGLDGKLLSMQVSLEEIPAPVRKTIETHAAPGKLEDVYRTFDGAAISYYVEIIRDGKKRDFSVAADGKLESAQVFLPETPPEVQRTINEKIANGHLVRIDRMFAQRQGAVPFEVESRKDGKPFNFSVGPRGRFLGMDE